MEKAFANGLVFDKYRGYKNFILYVLGVMKFFVKLLFLGIGGTFIYSSVFAANSCPTISVDPTTKKVTVQPCPDEKKENSTDTGSTAQSGTISKTNTGVIVVVPKKETGKKQIEKNNEKKEGTTPLLEQKRISEDGVCPEIYVDTKTQHISVVECKQQKDPIALTGSSSSRSSTSTAASDSTSSLSEFEQALAWMYANGLTQYDNEKDYRANDPLLREEAAKMFSRAYSVLGYNVKAIKNNKCEFSDEKEFNVNLMPYITDSCHWGLFKGYDNKFMPKQQLSKAQATAVLIRILEGRLSYENLNPWWTNYYQKAFLLGITTINNINIYDKIQNRKEIALMLWRVKKVVEDQNKDKWLEQLEKVEIQSSTGTLLQNWEKDLEKILGDINFETDPELLEAVKWMHDNGLTNFSTIKAYQPENFLTRGVAAKIFNIFSTKLGIKDEEQLLPQSCVFSDISGLDKELILSIQGVCKKGLMGGINGKFKPNEYMLKSEFMVLLVRLFDGNVEKVANGNVWWKAYFDKARELGLVDLTDINSIDKAIRRYEVALFLYRFQVKYNIVNNLNTTTVDNQLVTTIAETKKKKDGKNIVDAYVDMSLFKSNDLQLSYVYLFGSRYKIVKTLRRDYIDNAFVWYGDVYDLIDNKKMGTVNFIIRNNALISGVIRVGEKNYILEKKSGVDAYFTVIES